jgi:hypothetical protein
MHARCTCLGSGAEGMRARQALMLYLVGSAEQPPAPAPLLPASEPLPIDALLSAAGLLSLAQGAPIRHAHRRLCLHLIHIPKSKQVLYRVWGRRVRWHVPAYHARTFTRELLCGQLSRACTVGCPAARRACA